MMERHGEEEEVSERRSTGRQTVTAAPHCQKVEACGEVGGCGPAGGCGGIAGCSTVGCGCVGQTLNVPVGDRAEPFSLSCLLNSQVDRARLMLSHAWSRLAVAVC